MKTSKMENNNIIIIREFDAPVAVVWEAWTKPEYVAQWWGPKGFNTIVKNLDFKPGGKWEYLMIDDNGNEYPAEGVFQEIILHEKITSTDDFTAEFRAASTQDLPENLRLITLFENLGNKTKLTLISELNSPEDKEKHLKMGVIGGWNSSFDKLADFMLNLH